MATAGYVKTLVGGLPSDIKKVLGQIAEYILGNLKFGRPDHQTRSENLQAYFIEGRTSVTPGVEFSIAHGLSSTPYLVLQVLNPLSVGAQYVPLEVSRPADMNRVYFTSTVGNALITLLVEAP